MNKGSSPYWISVRSYIKRSELPNTPISAAGILHQSVVRNRDPAVHKPTHYMFRGPMLKYGLPSKKKGVPCKL
jgi:hypothetical protein